MKCGKSTLVKGHVKLADGAICTPCFLKLGFKLSDATTSSLYTFDEIKDGKDAMYRKKAAKAALEYDYNEANKVGLTLKHYRQLENAGATDMEKKILAAICAVLYDEGRDFEIIDAALGDNGSLLLMLDGTVFIEYKADSGVKWIRFDNEGSDKVRIGGAARMNALAPRIVAAYDSIPF
jgi:hypothetical protein